MKTCTVAATVISLSLLHGCSRQAIDDLTVLDVARASSAEVLGQLDPYYAEGLRSNSAIKGFVQVTVATRENVVKKAVEAHESLAFDSYRCGSVRASEPPLGLPGVYIDGKELRRLAIDDPTIVSAMTRDHEGRYVYQAYIFDTVFENASAGDGSDPGICLRVRGASMLSSFYSNEVKVPSNVLGTR